ncbi:MAG: DinB family protein [Flavobacteriales bacterium]|nr:DinB family protein [Flavobacteriales bacterium]
MNIEKAIKAWHERLDSVTQQVEDEFGALTQEQLNWKLSASEWSIAEVLEHLNLVNASYEKVLLDAANGKSDMGFTSKIGFVVNFLGKMIYDSVEPSRVKKIKTFPIWEPVQSDVSKDVIADFKKLQQDIKTLIKNCKPLLKNDAVIPSPVNRYIVYKLRKAVEIIVSHEERHLKQAMRIKVLIID